MIDRHFRVSYHPGYGVSFYLLGGMLLLSSAVSNAFAEDAAVKSNAVALTKVVTFEEILKQSNDDGLGEIVPIGDVEITVAHGDSLSSILRRNLGSLSALREIERYNKLDAPDALEPGQKIQIPAYLFPDQSITQSVQRVSLNATEQDSAVQSVQSEELYVVVDLQELSTEAAQKSAIQTAESEEEYIVVDLQSLSSANPEPVLQPTELEEQYIVVDLQELSASINGEITEQSTQAPVQVEEEFLVVDLTGLNMSPDRRVKVNRGDSLSSILRDNLGSLRALGEVMRYNSLDTSDVLQPGQIILIPGYL